MAVGLYLLQAATDSLPAYRDFPVIGSRAAAARRCGSRPRST